MGSSNWMLLTGLAFIVCVVAAETPVGHMQRLGSWRPAEPHVDVHEGFITPRKLWDDYILKDKPMLMKRAVSKLWAGVEKWTDEYLIKVAGDHTVQVEAMKKEDRVSPNEQMSLKEFIGIYNHPTRYYITGELPKALLPDMSLYKEYQQIMLKPPEPFMWFSSGNTASFLHRDDQWNINCLVSGHKEWFVVDKKYMKDLYMSTKYSGYGERSPHDVDKVDLIKWPRTKNVPWYNITMDAGDCFFLPGGWFHQVRGFGRNLAVNLWFWPPMKPWTRKPENLERPNKLTNTSDGSVLEVESFDKKSWGWVNANDADRPPAEDERGSPQGPSAYGMEREDEASQGRGGDADGYGEDDYDDDGSSYGQQTLGQYGQGYVYGKGNQPEEEQDDGRGGGGGNDQRPPGQASYSGDYPNVLNEDAYPDVDMEEWMRENAGGEGEGEGEGDGYEAAAGGRGGAGDERYGNDERGQSRGGGKAGSQSNDEDDFAEDFDSGRGGRQGRDEL